MRSVKTTRLGAVLAPALMMLAGCAATPAPLPAPVPESVTRPRVITNLSSVSPASTVAAIDLPPAPAPQPSAAAVPLSDSPKDLGRLFTDQPGREQFVGKASAPADERLLNAKAAKFAEFSHTLLHQVYIAAQGLEQGDISTKVLPNDTPAVVITAIMDRDGKLRELIIEQRSGSGVLDHLMVDACKQGLWTRNPPPEAMTDGEYQIRIEGRLKNFSSTDQKHWEFETHLGLALL
jgi:hypothetical protein